MYRVMVRNSFSAAHQIKGGDGRCEQMHGHNYRVDVVVGSEHLNPPGVVIDFSELREKLSSMLPDHKLLNEVYNFNPTAENLARYFFDEMARYYPVIKVRVWENDECWAEYQRD